MRDVSFDRRGDAAWSDSQCRKGIGPGEASAARSRWDRERTWRSGGYAIPSNCAPKSACTGQSRSCWPVTRRGPQKTTANADGKHIGVGFVGVLVAGIDDALILQAHIVNLEKVVAGANAGEEVDVAVGELVALRRPAPRRCSRQLKSLLENSAAEPAHKLPSDSSAATHPAPIP